MNKQVLLATYKDLSIAQHAIHDLDGLNIDRGDIGLAARADGEAADRALVTVTIDYGSNTEVAEMLESFHPIALDARPVQWRQREQDHPIPDETRYTALPLAHR